MASRLPFLMKRAGLVLSNARFASAQLERYLADDRWLERARLANRKAAHLAMRLEAIDAVDIVGTVEINMVFARMPAPAIDALDR